MADQSLALAIASGGASGVVIGVVLLLSMHRRMIFSSLVVGCLLGAGAMAVPAAPSAINETIIEKIQARVPTVIVPARPEVRRLIRRRWMHRRPIARPRPPVAAAPLPWWLSQPASTAR